MTPEERFSAVGFTVVWAVIMVASGVSMFGYLARSAFGDTTPLYGVAQAAGGAVGFWAFWKTRKKEQK